MSLDILREPALARQIVAYAGDRRAVRLIPYAATEEFYQLARALEADYGLEVILPESPAPGKLWLRNFIDSKTGFQALAAHWLAGEAVTMPLSLGCHNLDEAEGAVRWFLGAGCGCVVKADRGESGIGHLLFQPGQPASHGIRQRLESDPYLRGDLILVEEWIQSPQNLSPSLEFFVPPEGPPRVTYLSQQLFTGFGRFAGVMISRSLIEAPWYPALERAGLRLADGLQSMGYVGHFDLDAVVDAAGRAHLLELNARRTGGTYAHEFACHALGPDYLERAVVLCCNAIPTGEVRNIDALLAACEDLLFCGQMPGVVVTVTSTLAAGEIGCIFVAPDEAGVLASKDALLARLGSLELARQGG